MTSLSEFGEEEEDVKPSVEFLNSLGDYRKRSRSAEDVGNGGPVKTPKLNGLSTPNGFITKELESPPVVAEVEETTTKAGIVDDPVVMGAYVVVHRFCGADVARAIVNGQPVPFSQITEEHQDAMTPDEYTAYFEIIQAGM